MSIMILIRKEYNEKNDSYSYLFPNSKLMMTKPGSLRAPRSPAAGVHRVFLGPRGPQVTTLGAAAFEGCTGLSATGLENSTVEAVGAGVLVPDR